MKCYLSNQNNPWLILQPIQLEIFHSKPYIAMIHNLLSDKESDMIRELAAPKVCLYIFYLKSKFIYSFFKA